jgi:hypothetical protein
MDANLPAYDRRVMFGRRDSLIFSLDCDIIMVNSPTINFLSTKRGG